MVASDHAIGSWLATFSSRRTGAGYVEVTIDGGEPWQTPLGSEGREHRISLRGLYPGAAVEVTPVVTTGSGDDRGETVALAPEGLQGLPTVDVIVYEPDEVAPGLVLTSLHGFDLSWPVILDRQGRIVWGTLRGWASIPSPTLGSDGAIWFNPSAHHIEDYRFFVRTTPDGEELRLVNAPLQHHDFVELPDGTIAYLGVEVVEAEVDGVVVDVISDLVMELPAGGLGAVATRFALESVVDIERPCEHFDDSHYGLDAHDWSHANSLLYLEDDDQFLMMSKNLDALFAIDRQTGGLVWQLGGAGSDFSTTSRPFSHAHMSDWWDGGMLVFDNAYHHEGQVSRVVEYAVDIEGRTYEEVWSFDHPEGAFVQSLGDARRLPNGNVLVSWHDERQMMEVTRDGRIVWWIETSAEMGFARASWISGLYEATLDIEASQQ